MTAPHPARSMRIGLMPGISDDSFQDRAPRFSDVRAKALLAEQAGFDSFWLADHFIHRADGNPASGQWEVFSVLGGIAAVTSRMTIGPLVACTSFRAPALLAKIADTLDDMSDGRFVLGLGAGWHEPEYTAFGFPLTIA